MAEMRNEKRIKRIISNIKRGFIDDLAEIPEEFINEPEIIRAERQYGIITFLEKGFDVLSQKFFIKETYKKVELITQTLLFNTFDEYYVYLDGNIYDDACYYGYMFSTDVIKKYKLDTSKLNYTALNTQKASTILPSEYQNSTGDFYNIEKNKKRILQWIKKYNACNDYQEYKSINQKHNNSKDIANESFYLWNYITEKKNDSLDILFQMFNSSDYDWYPCTIRNIKAAIPFFIKDKNQILCRYHKKDNYLEYVDKVFKSKEDHAVLYYRTKFFDSATHFFCVKETFSIDSGVTECASFYRFFPDFEEFALFLNNDMEDANLMYAINITIDDRFKINERTKLPLKDIGALGRKYCKKYNRHKKWFEVEISWLDKKNNIIFKDSYHFEHFFDFASFLDNDLSGADLISCEGLENLGHDTGIILDGASLTSQAKDVVGLAYETYRIDDGLVTTFPIIANNESNNQLQETTYSFETLAEAKYSDNVIYYISDMHLGHTIEHAIKQNKVKNTEDVIYLIRNIVDNMMSDMQPCFARKLLLIGGDVSSYFDTFELFVSELKNWIDSKHLNITVIFVLGNHELWGLEGHTYKEIVNTYKELLLQNNMYLLDNELLYSSDEHNLSIITEDEIIESDEDALRLKIRNARLLILGGMGGAGCNEEFNANDGAYKTVLNRDDEIALSENFSRLYSKIANTLGDRTLIVFTHMNIWEWQKGYELHDHYIYVSGHSHINTFYDDGIKRLYADNQIGYFNDAPHLKYFLIDGSYDWFSDYKDGIYEISREDYLYFYRGKNLNVRFNREYLRLFMLKKAGYYCFIMRNENGKLYILNGGNIKLLKMRDINYYYDNMYNVIQFIQTPLTKYQAFQEKISAEIKAFGGSGKIHGAIIDIDGNDGFGWSSIAYNHLYINPVDLSITPYYALDIELKFVYPSLPALLHKNQPALYNNYLKLLESKDKNAIVINPIIKNDLDVEPELYLSTDIYKASRELRKMQKLNSNILSVWYDDVPEIMSLPQKEQIEETKSFYIEKSEKTE